MSALAKFYVALATAMALFAVGFVEADGTPVMGAIASLTVLTAAFVCGTYIFKLARCPRCGWQLSSKRKSILRMGLPGRFCAQCHYDLLRTLRDEL